MAWRFKTMQILWNSLPRFFILFAAQKGNAPGLPRSGRSVAKDNGTCRDWQSTMTEGKGESSGRGIPWIESGVFLLPRKSPPSGWMGSLVCGETAKESLIEFHYSSVYFRRIEGSVRILRSRQKIRRISADRDAVADKLSSLRHRPFRALFRRSIFDLFTSGSSEPDKKRTHRGCFISHWEGELVSGPFVGLAHLSIFCILQDGSSKRCIIFCRS